MTQPVTPPSQSATPPVVMQADNHDSPLPPYWEARQTEDGHIFYVVRV